LDILKTMAMNDNPIQSDPEYIGIKQVLKFVHFFGRKINRISFKLRLRLYRMEFGERDDDIYIVTFPKSGTTMTQVILYQLVTGGEGPMDFHHIYDVSPWVSNDVHSGRSPRKELPAPRVIKSHDRYEDFEKNAKGRFIYVYRNGMDVCVSLYNQNKNYNNPNLKFDEFFEQFTKPHKDSWFAHMRDWFRNKNRHSILYVSYEDLIARKETEIRRMAEFLNIPLSEKALASALEYSSFDYMKEHESKFGIQPPDYGKMVFDQFIRKGKAGEGRKLLSDEQQVAFLQLQEKFFSGSNITKNIL
jgi:hypothetical protein